MTTTRWCPSCQRMQPVERFNRNRARPGGLATYCKTCEQARIKKTPSAQPTAKRAYHRAYHLKSKGLTVERYLAILAAQGGGCGICHSADPKHPSGTFLVDHDHTCCPGTKSCGRCVRGLLCNPCNTGLGGFRDQPELLRAAIQYVLSGGVDGTLGGDPTT